jgi:hypothetical protein
MSDYTDPQCAMERDVTLAECLEACIELSKRLQAQADVQPTWPRNGTLLSVRNDIREVLAKLPAPVVMTETEMIEQAAIRG